MLQNQSPEVEFAFAVLTTCEDQPAVKKLAPTEAKAIIFTEQVIYHQITEEKIGSNIQVINSPSYFITKPFRLIQNFQLDTHLT